MSVEKIETAKKVLEKLGSAKQADLMRRLKESLESLKGQSSVAKTLSKDVAMMSRAVMRQPKPEVVEKLNKVRKKLSVFFADAPDEGVQWVLEGSSEHARGGFKDVAAFRKFLGAKDNELTSSRLLTGLESTLTAMGYRMVSAREGKEPYDPQKHPDATSAQKAMHQKLVDKIRYIGLAHSEKNDQRTATTSSTYINRATDCIWTEPDRVDEDITLLPEDVSEVSEAEDVAIKKPQQVMASRTFKQYNESPELKDVAQEEKLSWVGAAKAANIPVRAHTSGTTSILLGALAGICKTDLSTDDYQEQIDCSDVLNTEANIKLIAGALVVPTFLRGDYHTTAETFAGVTHFIDQTVGKKEKKQLQPFEAFEGGLQLLQNSCSDEKVEGFDMSLSEAVAIIGQEALKQVKNIGANLRTQDVPRKGI